jgi:hypothetical protein
VRQIRSLFVAFTLLVSVPSAQARIFDVSATYYGTYYSPPGGTFSGTVTIDVSAGKVTGVDITFPGIARFTQLADSADASGIFVGSKWYIVAKDSSLTAQLYLEFTTPNPQTLVGFNGGMISAGEVYTECTPGYPTPGSGCNRNVATGIRGSITPRPPRRFAPWCLMSTILLPDCGASGVPICTKPIPCDFFGKPGSTCAEWACAPRWRIPRQRVPRTG